MIRVPHAGGVHRPPSWMQYEIPINLRPYLPYVDRPGRPGSIESRAPPGPHELSIQTLIFWLRICAGSHSDHCQLAYSPGSPGPLWLIDVQNHSVVAAQGTSRYVALSYVWGGVESVSASLTNMHILQQAGSLLSPEMRIPQTLRDAIKLVADLGERFLWVDRLCIVQDDHSAKHSQLAAMATIYGKAYFTIIAAQGVDANEPLNYSIVGCTPAAENVNCGCTSSLVSADRGQPRETLISKTNHLFKPSLRLENNVGFKLGPTNSFRGDEFIIPRLCHRRGPRGGKQKTHMASFEPSTPLRQSFVRSSQACHHETEFQKRWTVERHEYHDLLMQDHCTTLQQTKWFTRGWAFQEYLFSRRKLIFHDNTVNWECHCAAWHEMQASISPGRCLGNPPSNALGFEAQPWPDFARYGRIVSLFSQKDLSFDEDVLDAFTGVLATFAPVFKGGFISGLPQMFFDAALLWQPYEPMIRRKASGQTTNMTVPATWSWAGWHGDLDSKSWRSGYSYLRHSPARDGYAPFCSWDTIQTVEWRYADTPLRAGTLIETLPEEAKHFNSQTQTLPCNWSQKLCLRTDRPYYTHKCDSNQGFWYPIPIQQDRFELDMIPRPSFIHTDKTRSATVTMTDFFQATTSNCCTAVLRTKDGLWAGVLRLNCTLEGNNVRNGDSCDLIELSRGSVENDKSENIGFDEWDLEECPRHRGVYLFVNVMWIEWTDGKAYRKAVGRVVSHIWESIAQEQVNLTLG
jgi:hypothetical protein